MCQCANYNGCQNENNVCFIPDDKMYRQFQRIQLAYWHIGTLAHWHIGTSAHQHISTLAHWHIGTSAHWHIGTLIVILPSEHIQPETKRIHGGARFRSGNGIMNRIGAVHDSAF